MKTNKNKLIYVVVILLAVTSSGCVEQTDQFIKHPNIPGISAGDKPVTDTDKIIGKWVMPDPGAAQYGYETSYTFNIDHTGEKVDLLYGKSFFKYQLFQNNITFSDIKPCKGWDIVSGCQETKKQYEFYNDNTLIIDNTVFERK